MTTAARHVLKELLDPPRGPGWDACVSQEWATPLGLPHQLTHTVTLRVVALGHTLECAGSGASKDAAKDAAAVVALDKLEPNWRTRRAHTSEREKQRAQALVGDAALDLLLALLAHARDLPVACTDALRQDTLTNSSLGGGVAGTARATGVEAAVGRAVLQCGLERALRDSLTDAGHGDLLRAIEDAVQREATALMTPVPETNEI
jgi:hypothetical protein